MEIQLVGTLGTVCSLITSPMCTVLLPVFQSKIKGQVNLGRIRFCFCVNSCNIFVIRMLPKQFFNYSFSSFIHLCCVTTVFIATQLFLILFSCFYKHCTVLTKMRNDVKQPTASKKRPEMTCKEQILTSWNPST